MELYQFYSSCSFRGLFGYFKEMFMQIVFSLVVIKESRDSNYILLILIPIRLVRYRIQAIMQVMVGMPLVRRPRGSLQLVCLAIIKPWAIQFLLRPELRLVLEILTAFVDKQILFRFLFLVSLTYLFNFLVKGSRKTHWFTHCFRNASWTSQKCIGLFIPYSGSDR